MASFWHNTRSLTIRHFTPTLTFPLALTFLNLACFSILQFLFYFLTQASFNHCPLYVKFHARYWGHEDETDIMALLPKCHITADKPKTQFNPLPFSTFPPRKFSSFPISVISVYYWDLQPQNHIFKSQLSYISNLSVKFNCSSLHCLLYFFSVSLPSSL